MHYAAPILDPKTLLPITTVTLYLWPMLVVAVIGFIRRRTLVKGVPFVVLGYLICVGVQSFVRSVGFTIAWSRYIGVAEKDQIVVALVDASLTVLALSLLVSIAPVLWMANVCAEKSSTANNRLERSRVASSVSRGGTG